jgi:hypothetical protein
MSSRACHREHQSPLAALQVVKPISRNYMAFLYDPMNIRSWNPSECNGGGEFSFIAAQQLLPGIWRSSKLQSSTSSRTDL